MVDLAPQLCTAKVMHKRLFPKVNGFTYGVYYLACPLSSLSALRLPVPFSFRMRDYGAKDGSDLQAWIDVILKQHNIEAGGEVILVTMPRMLGYGFNPVSFWLCLDKQRQLRAMLYEVNNTFGETHSYLCAHADGRVIQPDDVLTGEKVFHVSPFLPREGAYHFRVHFSPEKKLGVWIDYYAADGKKQLLTSMVGNLQPLTRKALRQSFFRYPLLTFKVITLIHYHALRLFFKGVKYIPRPQQHAMRLSQNDKDDKNVISSPSAAQPKTDTMAKDKDERL